MSEDFEGGFPAGWQRFDQGGGAGEYLWGKRACRPFGGGYSGWAVGGGDGATLPCGASYPDEVDSQMVYGPFSLADAVGGYLSLRYWINTEAGWDTFWWSASLDGLHFYGYYVSGEDRNWREATLDFNFVPFLGDLAGEPQVWVAFRFESDLWDNRAEGAYVDNIVLRKCVGGDCSSAAPSGAAPNAAIGAYSLRR
jgi:hypothetical protein